MPQRRAFSMSSGTETSRGEGGNDSWLSWPPPQRAPWESCSSRKPTSAALPTRLAGSATMWSPMARGTLALRPTRLPFTQVPLVDWSRSSSVTRPPLAARSFSEKCSCETRESETTTVFTGSLPQQTRTVRTATELAGSSGSTVREPRTRSKLDVVFGFIETSDSTGSSLQPSVPAVEQPSTSTVESGARTSGSSEDSSLSPSSCSIGSRTDSTRRPSAVASLPGETGAGVALSLSFASEIHSCRKVSMMEGSVLIVMLMSSSWTGPWTSIPTLRLRGRGRGAVAAAAQPRGPPALSGP
mmetsp:Transcript_40072/g.115557  ORF Transcript_40072/g.115557 Transcript_40072/m.115557 type:complete len:299 (+) Transcript_40072:556-1452(+)